MQSEGIAHSAEELLRYRKPVQSPDAVPITGASQTPTLNSGTTVMLFAARTAIGANNGFGGSLSKAQYAVAPNGQRFLLNMTAADSATSPITVVLNWDAALKQIVLPK
jgi:hypothetical protein